MQKTIICSNNIHGFNQFSFIYGNKTYWLFNEKFYKGNYEYFKNGIDFNKLNLAVRSKSYIIKKTAQKLLKQLKYIQTEENIVIFDKKENLLSTNYLKYKTKTKNLCRGYFDLNNESIQICA